jgi:hypothetical protein
MSNPQFIPERYCTFSAQLAATIGLEEAVLLQGLSHQLGSGAAESKTISVPALLAEFPFWDEIKVNRLLQRLVELGIIAATPTSDPSIWSTGGHRQNRAAAQTHNTQAWRPSEHVIDLLNLNHGLTRDYILSQLKSFDRTGDPKAYDSRFRQHVLSQWRHSQRHPAFDIKEPPKFDNQWQPSTDAQEILVRAEIPASFCDSLRPEFILYWKERGGAPKDVNSKFIQFVRQRWVRHENSIQHSTLPERLSPQWRPNEAVYETLLLSGISEDYADSVLNEFVVYWVDSNEVHTSWNAKFLQHVKYQWQRHQEQTSGRSTPGGGTSPTDRTKDRSISDDLSDTSWAG